MSDIIKSIRKVSKWADCKKANFDLANAIYHIAEADPELTNPGVEALAERIWSNPTEAEREEVRAILNTEYRKRF